MNNSEKTVAVLWPKFSRKTEKAVLVGLHLPGRDREEIEESLDELRLLAETAGISETRIEITKRESPDPAFYIGSGKTEELAELCRTKGFNVVIFDDDLAPAQGRNLQNYIGVKVIDRTEIILDIFAQHARSAEGKIQVELAQLQYMLPRLVHAWTHLSRQWGGVGTRGPGERQLEVDRRKVRAHITKLKDDLKHLGSQRHLHRRRRERAGIPLLSIIGYTNAGKTTFFNSVTGSSLPVEDKLFTTLDTKVKKTILPNNQPVLFSDTVGFINKLPHHLVEAFKATLEEVKEADVLLHIIDANTHNIEQRYDVVMDLLKELDAGNKPIITVVNKIDAIEAKEAVGRACRKFSNSIPISAKRGDGIDDLLGKIQQELNKLREELELFIPNEFQKEVSRIYNIGKVIKIDYTVKGAKIKAEIPRQAIGEFSRWVTKET